MNDQLVLNVIEKKTRFKTKRINGPQIVKMIPEYIAKSRLPANIIVRIEVNDAGAHKQNETSRSREAYINKEPSTGDALAALGKCHARYSLAEHLTINSNAALRRMRG
jgi:hypothetical protein